MGFYKNEIPSIPNTSSLKSFDSEGSTHFAKDLKYNGKGTQKQILPR